MVTVEPVGIPWFLCLTITLVWPLVVKNGLAFSGFATIAAFSKFTIPLAVVSKLALLILNIRSLV